MFTMQAMKPALRATSKQRKFYRILAGHSARRGITRGGLNELIQTFTPNKIAQARRIYNGQRRASKFVRWILGRLQAKPGQVAGMVGCSREVGALALHNYPKEQVREAVRAWREAKEEK